MPGLCTPSGISDVVMCFRQGGGVGGGGGGEAAGCLLLVDVEEDKGELVRLCVEGTDCAESLVRFARLARFLVLAPNAWTLLMSSGLQC